MLRILCISLALICSAQSLSAQIEKITIRWTSSLCILPSCIRELEDQFRKIPGVADVSINQQTGTAVLSWREGQPLSYQPIRAAMSMLGLYVQDLRLKARGKIAASTSDMRLISSGDGTSIVIMGRLNPSLSTYNERNSIYAYSLSDQTKAELTQAAQNNSTVEIDGPWFEAYRDSTIRVIAESINVIKEQK